MIRTEKKPKAPKLDKDGMPSFLPGKPGRPKTGREQITLMLSSEVLAKFKATGEGWRLRIDEALRKATP